MTFKELGALVDALQNEHRDLFAHIGPHLIGVMLDDGGLVIVVDRELGALPVAPPATFRGYPVRVEPLERPQPLSREGSIRSTLHAQDAPDAPERRDWKPGDEIHGFADGYFGRRSYACRVVEEVGPDGLVTRNVSGDVERISRADADAIRDPHNNRTHCSENEPFTGACDHADRVADLRAAILTPATR